MKTDSNDFFCENFIVTIELKGLSPSSVRFTGGTCEVLYSDGWHNVTMQSHKQAINLKKYFEKNLSLKTNLCNGLNFSVNGTAGSPWKSDHTIIRPPQAAIQKSAGLKH